MGAAILANDEILLRLLPAMEELRSATRETVILGKRRKEDIVYLDVLESPEVIRYSARAGDTKPLHSTCIGKCMLSAMPQGDLSAWLEKHPPYRVTGNTITDQAALIANLEEGRQRGVFTTRGENVADVTALAVPVSVNNELFGLAVAGPSHRIDSRFELVRCALKDAQQSLLELDIAGHV
jgi:DNA-binding IclR family transcriptional regulator